MRLLVTIAVGIFLAEVIAMILVSFLSDLPYPLIVLIDACIMLILIFPFLYYLSVRPLIQHIEMRRKAENKLQRAYEELEIRIQDRTLELRYANSELEEEIAERRLAEQIIKENEEKYRSLFNSMTEGFALHEIICDAAGIPYDYRFLEINPSFERMTGLKRDATLGRTVKEVLPGIEETWIEKYGHVALGGQPIHFVDYTATTKKWYEIYCYSARKNQFAVLIFDITERKLAEVQLQYQAALLSNVNDAIIASDAEYRLTAWNSAAESLYGWKAEEVLGRNGLEIIRTEWLEKGPDEMRHAIAETGRWRGEATQMRRDGTRFPVEVSSIALRDAAGQLIGYVSVNRDITERKRTEEALRQSQLDLSRAQEVGQIGSWRMDVRKNELTWSDETHRIFAIPVGTPMTYESFLSTIHPEDRAHVDEKWSAALKGGSYDIEHRILVNGSIKWVREKAYLELDSDNTLLGGFGITQDITERKKIEEELRRTQEGLELRVMERTKELIDEIAERQEVERQLRIQTTAMEAAGDGILIADPGGNILWVNPALTHMSGYPEEELIGRSTRVFSSGIHDQEYYQHMWETILAGGKWQGEITNRRKDGSLYIEEQTIAPVRGEAGKISHFIAIKHNITRQKQAEAELERRNVELQTLSANEHKQRQLAETLRASAQALTQSLDLDIVIRTLLKHLRALVGADIASAIFQEGETFLSVRAVDGFETWTDPNRLLSIKIDSDTNPLFQKLLSTRRTLVIPETDMEPDWIVYPGTEPFHNRLLVPVIVEDRLIGTIALGKLEACYFTEEHVQWAEALVGQAAVAIQNAWLFEQVRAGRERLQFLSHRLVDVQESERRYIARELHDHAGQNLTSLMLGLGVIEKEAGKPEFVRTRAAELKTMTDHVLEDLHRLAIHLRPASLDHLGLAPALDQLVKAFTQDSHLPIRLKTVGFHEDERLPEEIETTLYRIVQEALTNVVRHARASQVDVLIERRGDTMLVIVEDNGTGFDASLVKLTEHLGLLGMQERTEMLGGTLTIESNPGNGTTLFVEVPYADPDFAR